MSIHRGRTLCPLLGVLFTAVALAGCGSSGGDDTVATGSDGPLSAEAPFVHAVGDTALGRQVFRFETFGNERF